MATLKSLQARIAKLQLQAETMMKTNSTRVVAQIHSLMHKHGLTMEDIGAKFGAKSVGRKTAVKSAIGKATTTVKYVDPKTGATWTGHGRAPAWIASAKNRDRFLVDGASGNAPAASKKEVKQGNYIRGVQPAKYRDPKTGAEWSGRGKAPGWLAGAKDRSRFLIDEAASPRPKAKVAVKKSGAAAKKVAVKKVAAKKAAAKKVGAKQADSDSKTS
jgi:DNA-binding protein H-NS